MFLYYVLIILQSLLIISHSSIARGYHQSPFNFGRLNLRGSFKKDACFFIELVFDVLTAKPRNSVKNNRLESERLEKVLKSLYLIFLFKVEIC